MTPDQETSLVAGNVANEPTAKTTLTLAVTGFVLSFFAVLNIAGLVLSILALRRTRTTGGPRGLALAGIIIASTTIVLTAIGITVLVVVFSSLFATCAELGPGTHYVDGITYTCS